MDLVPPLLPFAGLAFLSTGLLTASYLANNRTVYVYVVNQDGVNVEYRVDDAGQHPVADKSCLEDLMRR